MTQSESDHIFAAEIEMIDAQKRAGLDPAEVLILQVLAIVARYRRETSMCG